MGYGLYVLIGAVAGGALVWLVYDLKAKRVIDDLRKRLGIAEAENLRIGPLESQLSQAKAYGAELEDRIAELKADAAQKADTIASLNAQIVEQAKAAKDKLSLLNDVQGRFCQAMATLSETAMNCDNDEFVRVMEVNVTAFEKTLMEDLENWQSRDRARTQEVCDVADSEQVEGPLFGQDEALEGLIAVDDDSAAAAVEAEAEVRVVEEDPLVVIEDDEEDEAGTADSAVTDDAVEEAAEEVEERVIAVEAGVEVDADEEGIDAALKADGDAVARLEEELAQELDGSDDDDEFKLDFGDEGGGEQRVEAGADDSGEIGLAEDDSRGDGADAVNAASVDGEDGMTLSLKFPIRELPAVEDEGRAAEESSDETLKKKLNSESEDAKREAV